MRGTSRVLLVDFLIIDEQEIRKPVSDYTEAWNRHDGTACAALGVVDVSSHVFALVFLV